MTLATAILVLLTCAPGLLRTVETAQQIQLGDGTLSAPARRQHVELLTSTVTVHAGKPEWVDLRFRVEPGMHINSHAPHDETLIATEFRPGSKSAVQISDQRYPSGIPLRLDNADGELLSTYQGEFAIHMRVTAPAGAGTLEGSLRYQACDARSCYPPRTLPVQVGVTSR